MFLRNDNRHSFIVYGPEGSGKNVILQYCFQNDPDTQLVLLHCTAHTKAKQIHCLLSRYCIVTSGASGRVLKPKYKPNLVLYIKALNLVKPDKWGTCEVAAFLQQLLTYRGYYNESLEWINVENIQLVLSVNLSNSFNSNRLPSRFISLLRICYIEFPSEQNLITKTVSSLSTLKELANALVRIFLEIRTSFKQTDYFHYIFTAKDISKWVFGLRRYELQDIEKSYDPLMSAVVSEANRIFMDRLVTEGHRKKFKDILVEVLSAKCNAFDDRAQCYVSPQVSLASSVNMIDIPLLPLLFKDYQNELSKAANRYEFEVSQLNIPMFDDFVSLCSKIDRALTNQGGSVLLAGKCGMGRRAAVSLVANIHQMKIFSPNVSSLYGIKQFDNDLKEAMEYTAVNNEHSVFIIEDYQLIQSTFLQTLNSIITSGDFPGLFSQQDFDALAPKLRDQILQSGFEGDIHNFFAYKVKHLLHFAFLLDVDHESFVENCSENPTLMTECTIIWLTDWSFPTLVQIAEIILQKNSLHLNEEQVKYFPQLYESAPARSVVPLKYLIFIENYVKIFLSKQGIVKNSFQRVKGGVEKLTDAKDSVTVLQREAAKKSKLLAEKQEEANRALKAITESMTGAKEQRTDIEQLKIATEKENEKIESQKKLIEEQLREVQPLLDEARKAVGSIKSESLSEIRSLRAPPETIRDILQAVLLFMGILDTSWEAMRKFLAKNGVKEEIINFDAHGVTPEVRKKVVALVQSRQASFDPKNAKRASTAAAPLAAWVVANLQYSAILEKISPLEQEKHVLTRNLNKAEKKIQKLSEGLKNVDVKVADLKATFEVLMKETTEIKIELDEEQKKIDAAGTLLERLSGEFSRWRQQVDEFQSQLVQLEQYSIVSAAFITFLGSSTEQIRKNIVKCWLQLLHINQFDLIAFLSHDEEQLTWKNKGAPSDSLTLENLAIIFNANQIAFIIDPNGTVSQFLQKHFAEKNVEKISALRTDLITQIELGVRFGKTLIVDDVETIDPSLQSLLRKEFSLQGSRYMVNIGNKTIDYNEEFQLYFCTKNNQIDLPSHARSVVNETNFSTTKSGLSSQLLTLTINTEQPELEKRSIELTQNVEESKVKLEEIERLLLQTLTTTEGSLLGNKQLLDFLNKSKENSESITVSLKEAAILQKELSEQRDAYLPLAKDASALYFAVNDLHQFNHMYNFSATTIIKLFKKTILSFKASNSVASNFAELKKRLYGNVYNYVSRALFKADRLCFSLLFIKTIHADLFQQNEWELFVGLLVDDTAEDRRAKAIPWIKEDRMPDVSKLQKFLPALWSKLHLDQETVWNDFANCTDCELKIPPLVASHITEFQKLLVIQAVQPSRLYSAISLFVRKTLSLNSSDTTTFDLEKFYDEESSEKEPILVIIGAGADPTQVLEDLASSKIGLEKLHQMSMGQGQLQAAIEKLKYCADVGHWLCLKNLHISIESILLIYKEFSNLVRHSSFRLWLFTEADENFPAVVLQESIKVTYESPPGVKNNILRTFSQWQSSNVGGSIIKMQCLYVLAWLHALVQERRTYIPQAWTEFYEFNDSDLRAAKQAIETITANVQQETHVDWKYLRGLMQNVFYGGRIDNIYDFKTLTAYLKQNFNSTVINGRRIELCSNIRITSSSRVQDYITATESCFSNDDQPSLFGLPANIGNVWEVTQSKILIEKLRNAHIKNGKKAAFDRKKWQSLIGPFLNAWKRLNSQSSLHTMTLPQAKYSDDAVEEMLSLEFLHAVSLIQTIHHSLANLSKCIRGTLALTNSVTSVAESLMLHKTPEQWQDLWHGPNEPFQYISRLISKVKSVQELKSFAEQKKFFDTPLKLSKLFRPVAFLNALRQYAARDKKMSVDELKMQNAWGSKLLMEDFVLSITGIYIQGAIFEEELTHTQSSSRAFSEAPILSIVWTPLESSEVYNLSESVLLPLYVTPDRTDLVAELRVPCRDPSKWETASVALFLNSF